jgi:hypothetical protein
VSHKLRGHRFGPMGPDVTGGSRWGGRGAAIADLHRQLHEQDAEAAAGSDPSGDATA